MTNGPVPYNMKPKNTKLPAGHDDSLDTAEGPTDAEKRALPPIDWPAADLTPGPDDPPDAPLASPPTDPAVRSLPPFAWPSGGRASPNRPLRELVSPIPDLDPDVALWPVTLVQRWPFTGAPTSGQWPRGWIGVDNTSTMYVCTAAGEPGTWAVLASTAGAGWPAIDGVGPGNLTAETPSDDTVGYNFHAQGTGPFNLTTDDAHIYLNAGSDLFLNFDGYLEFTPNSSAMFVKMDQTSFTLDLSADSVNHLYIKNLPTTDPSLTDGVWDNGGLLALSESGSVEGVSMAQISTPADPASGSDKLYFKSDENLYRLTSLGVETLIGPGDNPWIAVGSGGGAPAFGANWGNVGAPYAGAEFRRVGDMVQLRGVPTTTNIATSTIFFLPVGYIPTSTRLFAVDSNSTFGELSVDNTGQVIAASGTFPGFMSLDGISFSVL